VQIARVIPIMAGEKVILRLKMSDIVRMLMNIFQPSSEFDTTAPTSDTEIAKQAST
jgi:hypothetical protein